MRKINPFIIVAFAGALFSIALVIAGHQPGLTNDSIAYYSAAHNLAEGNGMTLFDNSKMVQWPPLYPTLLALNSSSKALFLNTTLLLNGFCFAFTVLLLGFLFVRLQVRFVFQLFAALAISLAFNVFEIYTMAWTEPLFSTFVVIWFLVLTHMVKTGFNLRKILLLGFFTALACLTRYAGFTLWVSTIIVFSIFLLNNKKSLVKYILLYSSVSLLPVVVWLFRNWFVSESLMGNRGLMWRPVSHYIWRYVDIITGWISPMAWSFEVRVGLISGGLMILVLYTLNKIRKLSGKDNNQHGVIEFFKIGIKVKSMKSICFLIAAVFSLVYSTMIILSGWLGFSGDASERFLSPLFFPLILMVALLFGWFIKNLKSTLAQNVFITICFIWLIYPVGRFGKHLSAYIENGRGAFAKKEWLGKETIKWVTQNELEFPLYSSAHAAIFWYTGMNCKETGHRGVSMEEFAKKLPNKGAALIWFDSYKGFYHYDLNELQTVLDLSLIQKTGDGAIYHMQRK